MPVRRQGPTHRVPSHQLSELQVSGRRCQELISYSDSNELPPLKRIAILHIVAYIHSFYNCKIVVASMQLHPQNTTLSHCTHLFQSAHKCSSLHTPVSVCTQVLLSAHTCFSLHISAPVCCTQVPLSAHSCAHLASLQRPRRAPAHKCPSLHTAAHTLLGPSVQDVPLHTAVCTRLKYTNQQPRKCVAF